MKKLTSTALASLLVLSFSSTSLAATEIPESNLTQKVETTTSLSEIESIVDATAEQEDSTLTTDQKEELASLIYNEVQAIEQEMKTPEIETYALTSANVVNIFQTNLKRANSIKATYNKQVKEKGTVYANTYRLSIFYVLVKSGGAWDLKQTLGTKTTYYFKGVKKTGEYIGNYHYGYMGKAIGFNNTVLKSAAGMYQIKSGTSEWKFISSYFDDPADQKAITNGFTDYNNGYRFSHLIA